MLFARYNIFMNNLKKWRLQRKLTQKQVGILIGVSRSRVANIECFACALTYDLASLLVTSHKERLWLLGGDAYKREVRERSATKKYGTKKQK